MHLVDDVDLVLALLWTYVDILVETAYIVDRVVGGGIQLVYVERTLMQSSLTVGADVLPTPRGPQKRYA